MAEWLRTIVKKYLWFWLLLIILLAFFLRVYKVDSIPVSLYWDEAASTYNAYSIAQTGKDEFGTPFPLLFRSFEDYKAPGNIYLTAVSIKIFGLNEFSARASSVFFGTLTVFLTFLLVRDLFFYFRSKLKWSIKPEILGLISAFLLAISPWHIQFSRTGFEANIGVFFIVLGTWLFIKSLTKPLYLFISLFSFALSIYMYRSIHIFLPLFSLILFATFFKELRQFKKRIILGSILLFFLLVAPIVPWMLSDGGMARALQVSVVTNSNEEVFEAASKALEEGNTPLAKFFFNRRVVYVSEVLQNYLIHFSPFYLFLDGDSNLRHSSIDMGVMYLWELPFVLIGLFVIITRLPRRLGIFILLWILIAPIASSISVPNPHALRSLNMIPMPQLVVAMGMYWIYQVLQKKWRFLYMVILFICISIFFVRYLYLYYGVSASESSADWADGYKQLIEYVRPIEDKYEKIVISGHYWQPYIYVLFYSQYDPALYQSEGSKAKFGKYVFGGTAWDKEQMSTELGDVNLRKFAQGNYILVALSPEEYQTQKDTMVLLKKIYNHNGELVFIVGELQ